MMILLPTMKNLLYRPNFTFTEIYCYASLLYCNILQEQAEDQFSLYFLVTRIKPFHVFK